MLSMLDKVLQAILKMLIKKDERVLLWSNASPNSTFAPQKLDVSWQDYDSIHTEFKYDTGEDSHRNSESKSCVLRTRGHLQSIYLTSTGAMRACERYFLLTEDGIQFQSGWFGTGNAAAAIKETSCIPLKIYGVKSSGGAN